MKYQQKAKSKRMAAQHGRIGVSLERLGELDF